MWFAAIAGSASFKISRSGENAGKLPGSRLEEMRRAVWRESHRRLRRLDALWAEFNPFLLARSRVRLLF